MKLSILVIMFLVSCSPGIDRIQDSHDLKSDVDLFLSTTDPDVEVKILHRLKSAKVSHESVKGLLRQQKKPAYKKTSRALRKKINDNQPNSNVSICSSGGVK